MMNSFVNISRRLHLRKLSNFSLWVICITAALVVWRISLKDKLGKQSEKLRDLPEDLACKNPNLDPFDPEMMKFYEKLPPINCSKYETWVTVSPDGSFASISEAAEVVHGKITCNFADIIRVTDFHNEHAAVVETRRYYFNNSDIVAVDCKADADKAEWKNVIAGVRADVDLPEIDLSSVPNRDKPNVVMIAMDSISRNQYLRLLPKTYKRLSSMGALLLNSYNIVGDGTPAALTPILTGKAEDELPECRKTEKHGRFVGDVYPFIWNDYKKAGYVTVFLQELQRVGTYQHRLRGFNSTPTDHYLRPLYLEQSDNDCFMGTPQHMVGFNYFRNILRKYKNRPVFLFGFLAFLSHGSINNIQKADEDFKNFIDDMEKESLLENTIFIFYSDHGPRFSSTIRSTLQGRLEERMPMFSFLFPPWFSSAYPKAYAAFQKNQNRLSTPFDIHDTLRAILNTDFRPIKDDHQARRSQSLFSLIPASRNCSSANVAAHWCACQTWQEINMTDPRAISAAQAVIKSINNFTQPYSQYCHRFSLNRIGRALAASTNQEVRKFERSIVMHDGKAFLGWNTKGKEIQSGFDLIQVNIIAEPGSAQFEASVKFESLNKYTVKVPEISRTNKYGSQPACIQNINLNLRKYCICK